MLLEIGSATGTRAAALWWLWDTGTAGALTPLPARLVLSLGAMAMALQSLGYSIVTSDIDDQEVGDCVTSSCHPHVCLR